MNKKIQSLCRFKLALTINADSCLQWLCSPADNLMREHQHHTGMGKPLVAVWQHEYDAFN